MLVLDRRLRRTWKICPLAGMIIGHLTLPLEHDGDTLVHLAKIAGLDEAGVALDDYASTLIEEDFGLER